jgi:hypothetical protein
MLRSKSLDRDSYNSGDWFNRLDFTYQDNGWGSGLPLEGVNGGNWDVMRPLLETLLAPTSDEIEFAAAHAREMLEIRNSSELFSLETAAEVQDRVSFQNVGPDQIPGLIVMSLSDLVGEDLDPEYQQIVVLFNAGDEAVDFDSDLDGTELALHPVLADSVDDVVGTSAYDPVDGAFSIPARTTAVFVEDEPDTTPPTVHAELDLIDGQGQHGLFEVDVTCEDESETTTAIDINGIEVEAGQQVELYVAGGPQRYRWIRGTLRIWAPSFEMTVTCTDEAGNSTTVTVEPEFPGLPLD